MYASTWRSEVVDSDGPLMRARRSTPGRLTAAVGILALGYASPAIPQEGQSEGAFVGWRQIRTEHFTIVFEPRDAPHAEELASFAEERYRQIATFFGSFPRRIAVVLVGRVDVENGFASPLPPAITLHLGAPYGRTFGVHGGDWLELVFVHELTHYIHLSAQAGPLQWISRALGPTGPWLAALGLPGWLVEGTAVYAETAFTQTGRGRNEFFTLRSKAPILEGRWFDRWRAGYSSPFPPRGRHYVAGYLLVEHLQRQFGQRTVVQIMEDYLAFPFFGPWAAIRRATGRSYRQLWAELESELRDRYTPAGNATVDAVGVDVAQAMHGSGGRRAEAPWSAVNAPPQLYLGPVTSRGVLAYRTALTDSPALVLIRAGFGVQGDDDMQVEHLAPLRLADPHSMAATAVGDTVIYAAIHIRRDQPAGTETTSDLFRLDLTDGSRRRVTTGAHLWHPALSADGATLVAVQGVGPHSRLVLVDQATGGVQELASVKGGVMLHPVVRPDGAAVVFELNRGGDHDLYALSLDAPTRAASRRRPMAGFNEARMVRVTGPDESGEYFPSFTGGGTTLSFGSDRGGELAIYTIDRTSAATVGVLRDPVGAYAAVESGDHVYYASYTAAGNTIRRLPRHEFAVSAESGQHSTQERAQESAEPGRASSFSAPDLAIASTAAAPGEASGSDRATGDTRVHLDFPVPSLWLPFPSLLFLEAGVDLGFGVVALAASVRGTSKVLATAAYHPQLGQPVGALDVTLLAGRVGLTYGMTLNYGVSGSAHTRTTRHSARASVAVLDDVLHDRSLVRRLALSGTVNWSRVRTGTSTLPLDLAPPATVSTTTVATVGAEGEIRRFGSPKDLFSPAAVRAAIALGSPLESWQPLVEGVLSAQLPAFPAHVIRLRLQGATAPSSLIPLASAPGVRGDFDAGGLGRSRVVAAIDYLATLALVDVPLLGVASLGAITAGAHVEAAANWDEQGVAIQTDRVFVGLELGLLLGAGGVSQPIGAGVAVAIPDGEVRPYVFLALTPEPPLMRAGAR